MSELKRKRDSKGRFETETPENIHQEVATVKVEVPSNWLFKIMIGIAIIIISSPWIFLFVKNNGVSNLTTKVSGFYMDNFSCDRTCPIINSEPPKSTL